MNLTGRFISETQISTHAEQRNVLINLYSAGVMAVISPHCRISCSAHFNLERNFFSRAQQQRSRKNKKNLIRLNGQLQMGWVVKMIKSWPKKNEVNKQTKSHRMLDFTCQK